MCHFPSWILKEKIVYFLTDKDLATKEGKLLDPADIAGHGAIEQYYGIKGGTHEECEDLSSPNNFPKEIVQAIKDGWMCEFNPNALKVVLTPTAQKKYLEIEQPALKKYQEIQESAWEKYLEIQQSAWEKYLEIKQSAQKKYLEIDQSAHKKYLEIEQPAEKKYQAECSRILRELIQNPKNRIEEWR
jgi:hypothetical protein